MMVEGISRQHCNISSVTRTSQTANRACIISATLQRLAAGVATMIDLSAKVTVAQFVHYHHENIVEHPEERVFPPGCDIAK